MVPGGIELRGQAAVLDALVASSLRSRRGKNLVLESWSNFTASARSHDGRLLARLTVGKLYWWMHIEACIFHTIRRPEVILISHRGIKLHERPNLNYTRMAEI